MNFDSIIIFLVKFLKYIQHTTKLMYFRLGELTLPEPNAAIITRGGKHCACNIPAHSPHLGVVIIKLCHNMNFKFC